MMNSTAPVLAPKKQPAKAPAGKKSAPAASTPKKKSAPAASTPEKNSAPVASSKASTAAVAGGTTSEDVAAMYQKVSPIEHVLLRPEMYIGSIENHKVDSAWLFKPDAARGLFPRLLPAGPAFDKASYAVNGSMIERATGGGGNGEEGGGGSDEKSQRSSNDQTLNDDDEEEAAEDDENVSGSTPSTTNNKAVDSSAATENDVIIDSTGEFDEINGAVKGVDVRLLDPNNRIERIFGPGSLYQTAVCENPGLMKIVDEILVNAADNRLQSDKKTNPQTYIRVSVDDKTGRVTISNDGRGIPVVMHNEHNAFIPDLIFGHLLTSSHYSNDPNSTAAGRHGYGAKLTNIMSTNFDVECISEGKRFVGKWSDNMQKKTISIDENFDPKTTPDSGVLRDQETIDIQKLSGEIPKSRTTISFTPDFDRFMANDVKLMHDQATMKEEFDMLVAETEGKESIPDEKKDRLRYLSNSLAEMKLPLGFSIKSTMRDLIKKRCLDLAASIVGSGVSVYFNNELISPNSLAAYARMHFSPTNIETQPFILENKKDGFTICVSFTRPPVAAGVIGSATGANPNAPTNRVSIALVNSLVTPQGGTHLSHAQRAVDSAIAHVSAHIRKTIGLSLSDSLIRNNCQLFVSCNVKQPKFDSQSKQKLVSKHPYPHLHTKTLEAYMLSIPFLSEFCSINNAADLRKINMELKRLQDQKHIIDKLVEPPRNSAITYRTLILTEGDSAKALALNSLTTTQRESFGVYPLRGKVLNVRTNPISRLMKNKELLNVLAALGLQLKGEYQSLSALRYQRVIIMTDQDHDGTHIRGLLLNFFHYLWPQLMRDHPNFITIFSTPLVKVKIPAKLLDNDKELQMNFYNEKKFDDWREAIPAHKMQKIFVRYYKGLGTSTSKEGREYFEEIEDRLAAVEFNADESVDSSVLEEMFGGIASARRNRMDASRDAALASGENYTIAEQKTVTVPDFASKELVQYANYDNKRSIPCFVDGLKVSQRKVLWAMLTRNSGAMRVSQIAGYVSEMAHYHHGEASLVGSIIVMARDYVTSNNVPLLSPEGQFGSRSMEGHDHAAARYIFSKVAKVTRYIFPKEDDEHLKYINSDGDRVEPEFFAPVIPFTLVNGTRSIGFGYMNNLIPRNPLKVLAATRAVVNGETVASAFNADTLMPHFSGFLGSTKRDPVNGEIYTYGTVEIHATKASLSAMADIDLSQVCFREIPELTPELDKMVQVARGPEIMRDMVVLRITELPVGEVPSSYRNMVDSKMGDMVVNYADYSGADHIDIELTVKVAPLFARIKASREESFLTALGLRRRVPHDVLSGFDSKGNLIRAGQFVKFLGDYFEVRHDTYVRRLEALRKKCKFDIDRTNSIITFSKMVRGDKSLFKLNEEQLQTKLKSAKLLEIDGGFTYLTNRSITSLLDINFNSMTNRLENLKAEQIRLRTKVTPQSLWLHDLSELEKHLVDIDRKRVEGVQKALAPRTEKINSTHFDTILRANSTFRSFANDQSKYFPELAKKQPIKAHSVIMYTMKERGWTPAIQWRGVVRQVTLVERTKLRLRFHARRIRARKQKEWIKERNARKRELDTRRRLAQKAEMMEFKERELARVGAIKAKMKEEIDAMRRAREAKKQAKSAAAATSAAASAAVQKGRAAAAASSGGRKKVSKMILDTESSTHAVLPLTTTPNTIAFSAMVGIPIVDRIRMMQAARVTAAAKVQIGQFTATSLMNFARRFIF